MEETDRRPRFRARKARAIVLAAGLTLASTSTALAVPDTTPRHDPYVEDTCTVQGDGSYLAKRVDARAIDPGNKGTATQHYNENNPNGETCGEGPVINPSP
jgi:hypothetical protein